MEISNNFNIFWSAFNKPVYIISNYAIKRERKQKLPAALNAVGSKIRRRALMKAKLLCPPK